LPSCTDNKNFVADVVTIEKTGEFFRLIYDVKGRFAIHRITAEEAKVISYL
jgi:ribosomal protein S4E